MREIIAGWGSQGMEESEDEEEIPWGEAEQRRGVGSWGSHPAPNALEVHGGGRGGGWVADDMDRATKRPQRLQIKVNREGGRNPRPPTRGGPSHPKKRQAVGGRRLVTGAAEAAASTHRGETRRPPPIAIVKAAAAGSTSRAGASERYSRNHMSRSPGSVLHPQAPESLLRFSSPGKRREIVRRVPLSELLIHLSNRFMFTFHYAPSRFLSIFVSHTCNPHSAGPRMGGGGRGGQGCMHGQQRDRLPCNCHRSDSFASPPHQNDGPGSNQSRIY